MTQMKCPVTGATGPADGSVITLDPLVRDLRAESVQLLEAGPLAAVELPGGVQVWAVTHHAEARSLLTDPRLVKDIEVWDAWKRGEIAPDWVLIGLANPGRSMLTVDGDEHRRLRTLVAQALTPRRVEEMRERIGELTTGLLDTLPSDGDGAVDLKAEFAYPLPMYVVSELLGIHETDLPRLKELFEKFFSTQTPPQEVLATLMELAAIVGRTMAVKKEHPGADLTSAMLSAGEAGDGLTDEEIVGTLLLMIAAGHETTISLIVNAVRALLTHPDQLALVLAGEVSWETVIEETLRWSPPTSHVLIRFATEDVPVGEQVIRKGEALIVSYNAIGLDDKQHGETAREFDITRPGPIRHIAFGHGPHVCPGAALSRLEAGIALPALFERFPGLKLGVPADELRNKPVVTQNDLYELPVLLQG
jgi:cytochrome P450